MKRRYKVMIFILWSFIALSHPILMATYIGTIIGYVVRRKV